MFRSTVQGFNKVYQKIKFILQLHQLLTGRWCQAIKFMCTQALQTPEDWDLQFSIPEWVLDHPVSRWLGCTPSDCPPPPLRGCLNLPPAFVGSISLQKRDGQPDTQGGTSLSLAKRPSALVKICFVVSLHFSTSQAVFNGNYNEKMICFVAFQLDKNSH